MKKVSTLDINALSRLTQTITPNSYQIRTITIHLSNKFANILVVITLNNRFYWSKAFFVCQVLNIKLT